MEKYENNRRANSDGLSMVSEAGEPMIAEGQYLISIGVGQLDTGAPTIAGKFQVKGTKVLPE